MQLKQQFTQFREKFRTDTPFRRRTIVLVCGIMFFADYLMFCFHTEKGVLDIFPAIPVLQRVHNVTVYVPSHDAKELLSEERRVPVFESDERMVEFLLKTVVRGSARENTRSIVPADIHLRTVWFTKTGSGKTCIIDIEPVVLEKNASSIKGSEAAFKKALRKTIVANVDGIADVVILSRGNPALNLWEI